MPDRRENSRGGGLLDELLVRWLIDDFGGSHVFLELAAGDLFQQQFSIVIITQIP